MFEYHPGIASVDADGVALIRTHRLTLSSAQGWIGTNSTEKHSVLTKYRSLTSIYANNLH